MDSSAKPAGDAFQISRLEKSLESDKMEPSQSFHDHVMDIEVMDSGNSDHWQSTVGRKP